MRYVIGIGSNIGDKKENIERAIAAIETLPKTRIVLKSSIYETQPVGYEDRMIFIISALKFKVFSILLK